MEQSYNEGCHWDAEEVIEQSTGPDGRQSQIEISLDLFEPFNDEELNGGKTCGSFQPPNPDDCSTGSWVITVTWSEVCQTDCCGLHEVITNQSTEYDGSTKMMPCSGIAREQHKVVGTGPTSA
jgi:hypothetical protein